MQLVTMQWLVSNHTVFKNNVINKSILERLIRQNVRKVEFTQVLEAKDSITVYPKSARLYTKSEPSERFILILEGRVFVTIGEVNSF